MRKPAASGAGNNGVRTTARKSKKLQHQVGDCWPCGKTGHQHLDCPRPVTCPWCWVLGGHDTSNDSGPGSVAGNKEARWCKSLTQREITGRMLGLGTWCPVATYKGKSRSWKKDKRTGKWIPSKWKKVQRSRLWKRSRAKCFTCGASATWKCSKRNKKYRSPSCCTACLQSGGTEHGALCARCE